MHSKSPSVMAFCPVCLGILPYSWQNTSRDITCEQLLNPCLSLFGLMVLHIFGATKNSLYFYKLFFVYLTLLSYFFLRIYFIYCPAGFQESLSSLFSISFRSTVYATFTSLSFLTINSESPYSEPLSAQSYVYPSLVHGYFPSK